jgi:hypothetical protein
MKVNINKPERQTKKLETYLRTQKKKFVPEWLRSVYMILHATRP